MAVDQFLEQLDIFVIDEHRPWTHAIDPDGVFLFRLELGLGPLARLGVFRIESGSEGHRGAARQSKKLKPRHAGPRLRRDEDAESNHDFITSAAAYKPV